MSGADDPALSSNYIYWLVMVMAAKVWPGQKSTNRVPIKI